MLLIFITCVSIVLCCTNISGHIILEDDTLLNNRPIIGILSQELSYKLRKHYTKDYNSYIAASYVKFIEGAGARVVPIWIGKEESYYENILSKINGVLLPGGSTYFNRSRGYADAGYTIYKIAKKMNKKNDYFPVMGICLGFELLTYLVANRNEHRIPCNSLSQPLPLEFLPDYGKSRMFKDAPSNIISTLEQKNVTGNYHQFCVTRNSLKQYGISSKFRIMSVNHDLNGTEFISSLEHITLPFYGLQFHPEKNIYEWVKGKRIPHGKEAVNVARYFADFFVNEARKNGHTFPKDTSEEAESLIYNYPVTYTASSTSFVQCYIFKENETVNS